MITIEKLGLKNTLSGKNELHFQLAVLMQVHRNQLFSIVRDLFTSASSKLRL